MLEPFIHQCEYNSSRLMQGRSGRSANTKLHSDTFTASHWIKTLSQRCKTLLNINVLKTGGTLAVSERFIHQCEYNNSRLMQGRSWRFANTKLHSDTFTASPWIKTLPQRRNTLMIKKYKKIINVLKNWWHSCSVKTLHTPMWIQQFKTNARTFRALCKHKTA